MNASLDQARRADLRRVRFYDLMPPRRTPYCSAERSRPKLDPFGKIPEFKFCAARVEPAGLAREAAE